MKKKKQKIIIIGAGPAGLTAGFELLKKGYKVTILESDPKYVGGISRTVRYKDYRFDIGGHRFFSKNEKIQKWWEEVLGEDFLKRPRLSRWYYRRKFFNYPINIFEIIRKFGLFFSFRVIISHLWRRFFPIRSNDNLEKYYRNHFGDFLAKPFFIDYNEKLWGIPCRKLSTDFAKQRVKGVSIRKTILDSINKIYHRRLSRLTQINSKKFKLLEDSDVKSFITTFNYPKYGPGQLWEKVANEINNMGGEILMGYEVKKINTVRGRDVSVQRLYGRDSIKSVHVRTAKGEEDIKGDIFLSTMPYRDLVLSMQPNLSKKAIKAARSLKFRDFIIVALVINKSDICKDNWVYTHDIGMKPIRFQNFKNWSPYMVPNKNQTVIGMEYTCEYQDDFWGKDDKELVQQGMNDFVRLGFIKKNDVIDSHVVRMRNVYPVYDLGYKKRINVIRKELEKVENLHCFGRGGIHRYNNMDHSMMTAFLTVKNVLSGRKKYDVFRVNEDAEYHEER